MKPVVVFGVGMTAKLARFYLDHDSERQVVAFTVERAYADPPERYGLPVVPFDEVIHHYPPDAYDMFVAVGYARVNKFREQCYNAAKALGYTLINYVSSRATVWPDLDIGDNCFIMEHNIIQPFARIGNNVMMWSGSHVGHESEIMDHVFVASQVVISGSVVIEPNVFLGVNATIRDRLRIGRESVIGAGALVMKDTREREVLLGQASKPLGMTSDRLPGI